MKSPYPSRAAYKLKNGIDFFRKDHLISLEDRVCMDFGCAHGGFSQVLLEEGARRVYAVDVTYGMLDYKLRIDKRIITLERHNLRNVATDWLKQEDVAFLQETKETNKLFVTSDASFISAQTVLTSLEKFRRDYAIRLEALILIKPQFESSKETDHGIIRSPKLREKIVASVEKKAKQIGFSILGKTPVLPRGIHGNQEYMLYVHF